MSSAGPGLHGPGFNHTEAQPPIGLEVDSGNGSMPSYQVSSKVQGEAGKAFEGRHGGAWRCMGQIHQDPQGITQQHAYDGMQSLLFSPGEPTPVPAGGQREWERLRLSLASSTHDMVTRTCSSYGHRSEVSNELQENGCQAMEHRM